MAEYTGFKSENVRVAVTGRVYYAQGAKYSEVKAQVEDISSNLDTIDKFTALGNMSEDALEADFSDETENIVSWQSGNVRTIVKSREATMKCASLETSREAIQLFYGMSAENITSGANDGTVYKVDAAVARPTMVAVFEFRDGKLADGTTDRVFRFVMPQSQVSEVEAPKFTSGEAVTWGVTFSALGDPSDGLLRLISNDTAMAKGEKVDLVVEDQITEDGSVTVASATNGAQVAVNGGTAQAYAGQPLKFTDVLVDEAKGKVTEVVVTATKGTGSATRTVKVAYAPKAA
jgi:hypothetical protein